MEDVTQKYLREVIKDRKLYLKICDAKIILVSHYRGLKVCDIINYAKTKVYIRRYLLENEYNKEPNKAWRCNVANFLLRLQFFEKVKAQKLNLIHSQNLNKDKTRIFIIFKNSQSVHCKKVKVIYLLGCQRKQTTKLKLTIMKKVENWWNKNSKFREWNKWLNNKIWLI